MNTEVTNDQMLNVHRHHSIRKSHVHFISTIHRSSKYAFNLSIKVGRSAFRLDDISTQLWHGPFCLVLPYLIRISFIWLDIFRACTMHITCITNRCADRATAKHCNQTSIQLGTSTSFRYLYLIVP